MDDYKKPKKTYQDTLTDEEIKELLIDYTFVEDIFVVPINSHIRYFTLKNDKKLFRLGGYLNKIDIKKNYIVLSNGKTSWSVQVKDSTFFKKYSMDELKEYYDNKLKKYKSKIKKLENSLEEIKEKLKNKNKN